MKIDNYSDVSCPSCRSSHVYMADYDGMVEQTILRIVNICPFVCQTCDVRFYMFLVTRTRPERVRSWPTGRQCHTVVSSN